MGERFDAFLSLNLASCRVAGRQYNKVGAQVQLRDLGCLEQAVLSGLTILKEHQRRLVRLIFLGQTVNGEVNYLESAQWSSLLTFG